MADGYSAHDGAIDAGFTDVESANAYYKEFGTIELPPSDGLVVMSVEKYEQLKQKKWTDDDMKSAAISGHNNSVYNRETADWWLKNFKGGKYGIV